MTQRFADVAAQYFAAAERGRLDLLPPAAHVLEIGCGSGATGALALREGKAARWVGVETRPREAAEALYALSDVHSVALDALPYEGATFDMIFLGDDLAGLKKPKAALARLARLLRPGGWLMIEARGDPLPRWAAPERMVKLLRAAKLNAVSARASSDRRKRGLFQGRRYVSLQAAGRRAPGRKP